MADWLGEFEQVVLFAVGQIDDAYGATIRDEICAVVLALTIPPASNVCASG